MIKVKMRFLDSDGKLFEDQVNGFWSWRQFADYIRRLYLWRQKFEITSLQGHDSHSGRTRMFDGLEACTKKDCEDHWTGDNLFHWKMSVQPSDQTDEEFIRIINERVNNV